jgi:hypothetical protein
MQYAYAYQLNGSQTSGLDPNAKAYINAVIAAGATVNSTQRNAINTFYKTGKAQGWYGQLKRMFLPIWGIAAPNAIGMISGSSGTFNGTVTHASGYVQGDGSTGYFNIGASMPSDGLTFDNGLLFALCNQAPTVSSSYLGVVSGNNSQSIRAATTIIIQGRYTNNATNISGGNNMTGIITMCSQASNLRSFRRRSSVGSVSLGTSSTETASFSLANLNCYALGRHQQINTLNEPSNGRFGSYGYSLKMSDSDTDLFTLAIKNLWETCTGLTIP